MESKAAGQTLKFDTAALTHTGRVRPHNEDSIFADGERGLWLVADGMGGHRDGNLASRMIAEAAQALGKGPSLAASAEAFRDSIDAVNGKLLSMSDGHSRNIVGSTVVTLLVQDMNYCCLWAGDSRCYRVRDNGIAQISHDHTEVQDLVDRGVLTQAEAATWPRRNVITRAVGAMDDLELEQVTGMLRLGDCFILCSDGLTGHVNDEEILARSRLGAHQTSHELLELALARGGKDNISVVVVNVVARSATTVVMR